MRRMLPHLAVLARVKAEDGYEQRAALACADERLVVCHAQVRAEPHKRRPTSPAHAGATPCGVALTTQQLRGRAGAKLVQAQEGANMASGSA